MRSIRIPAPLACLLLIGFAAGATMSAQTAPEPSNASPQRFHFHPIVRVAQDYTLPAAETVREVRTFFGDVTIEGRVERDVVVTMGSARIGPTAVVEGSVAVVGGSATVDPGASIERSLIVIGGTLTAPPAFSPGHEHVVIGSAWVGDALREVAPWITRGLLWGRLIVPDLPWVWAIVGVFFLVYLVLNTVFDRAVGACAEALMDRPLSIFMAGLLVLLLMVPLIALVAASVIGLAILPFILCALIAAGLVGKTGVARAIGRSVMRSESSEGRVRSTMAFVMGFALLTLAYLVPVLGFVTWALTTVLGFGAATVTFRAMLRRERPAPPPPAPALPRDEPPAGYTERAHDIAPVAPLASAMPAAEPLPPRPAYDAGLAQYPRATFLDRVAAFALDCVLVAIANAVLDWDRHEGPFLLLLLAYHIAFWAWKGTTLGGIICGLRVVRTNGGDLRFVDALVRGLSSIFSIAALGIGCFWMLQDPERQMWHDKIAGTLVVRVPRDLVLA